MPNISIFRFKRSGLMQKACFLSTSNRPARATRFISVLCKLIMHESKNRTTLLEMPGFVFGADATAPLFFLNTVLCRPSSFKQEREMPLSVSAAWQYRSEQKRQYSPIHGVSLLSKKINSFVSPYRKQEPGR